MSEITTTLIIGLHSLSDTLIKILDDMDAHSILSLYISCKSISGHIDRYLRTVSDETFEKTPYNIYVYRYQFSGRILQLSNRYVMTNCDVRLINSPGHYLTGKYKIIYNNIHDHIIRINFRKEDPSASYAYIIHEAVHNMTQSFILMNVKKLGQYYRYKDGFITIYDMIHYIDLCDHIYDPDLSLMGICLNSLIDLTEKFEITELSDEAVCEYTKHIT